MHFLPLYSFIFMLMPFFNRVDLRTQAASVNKGSHRSSPNYAPLYANVYDFVTSNYDMPPPITIVDPDFVSKLATTTKTQSSQRINKYRLNPFKKGSTASSSKASSRPVSSSKPELAVSKKPSSTITSKHSSSSTDARDQAHVPTSVWEYRMIHAPFRALEFLSSPVVYIFRLIKKDVPKTAKYMTEEELEQHPLVNEICQVLASGGIRYPDCDRASEDVEDAEEMFMQATSPWSLEDKNGVKWKRATKGKDAGCLFYLSVNPMPLRMSATPNNDGTTDVSYFTKHTVGKYCPKDENDEEGIREFHDSLLDYTLKLSIFDILSNTKILFNYTLKNVVEFMFVVDAFVVASKKVLSFYSYRYWSFRFILSLYLIFYLGYIYYTQE